MFMLVLKAAGALPPDPKLSTRKRGRPAIGGSLRGNSVATLASEAHISSNNAAVRLHRAREALRRQLARSCGACTLHGCLDCDCGDPQR